MKKDSEKKSDIKQDTISLKLPTWHLDSIKNKQGVVTVVGGSEQCYYSPILTILGAEVGGADSINAFIPSIHFEAAKRYSLNIALNSLYYDTISINDVRSIHHSLSGSNLLVLSNSGPQSIDMQRGILSLLAKINIPVVIDGGAAFPGLFSSQHYNRNDWIVVLNREEFEVLFRLNANQENASKISKAYGCLICIKGMIDYIAHYDDVYANRTGAPHMRVQGTGDLLLGIIAAYRSMNLDAFDAVQSATFLYGRCAEFLLTSQCSVTAYDIAKDYRSIVSHVIMQYKHDMEEVLKRNDENNSVYN